jgi:phosphatidate cytidylyltransferase
MNNFTKRSLSGILYVLILLSGIWWKPIGFVFMLYLLQLMCAIETLTLLNLNRVLPRTLAVLAGLLAFLVSAQVFFGNIVLGERWLLPLLFILAIAHAVALAVLTFVKSSRVRLIKVDWLHATLYTLFPFTVPMLVFDMDDSWYMHFMTLTFVLIWVNDTFAFLFGKMLGKTLLIPRLSPKKTYEGLAGGVLMTFVVAIFIIPYFSDRLSPLALSGMAAITVVFGNIGDLYESKMKRRANVKDSGNLIPGHGGILDRLDSYLLIMPAASAFIYFILP